MFFVSYFSFFCPVSTPYIDIRKKKRDDRVETRFSLGFDNLCWCVPPARVDVCAVEDTRRCSLPEKRYPQKMIPEEIPRRAQTLAVGVKCRWRPVETGHPGSTPPPEYVKTRSIIDSYRLPDVFHIFTARRLRKRRSQKAAQLWFHPFPD